jgi:hypothetical protein
MNHIVINGFDNIFENVIKAIEIKERQPSQSANSYICDSKRLH